MFSRSQPVQFGKATGLPGLLTDKVRITSSRVKFGAANPTPKLLTLITSVRAGADSIDDVDALGAQKSRHQAK